MTIAPHRLKVNQQDQGQKSKVFRSKWLVFALASSAALALGLCLGEAFIQPTSGTLVGVLCLAAFFPIGWYIGGVKGNIRWFFTILLPLLLFLTWFAASLDLGNAVGECELQSDKLREALVLYKKRTGWYPVSLEQLGWTSLPGRRWIGPSVLHYDFGPDSFRLYFSAGLRSHSWASCSTIRKK